MQRTMANTPFEITGLTGDNLRLAPGATAFVDVGSNATVQSGLSLIYLDIVLGSSAGRIGFDTLSGRIGLSHGLDDGSTISIGGVVVATVDDTSDASSCYLNLSGQATPALVQELIRAMTFTDTSTSQGTIAFNAVNITLTDQNNITKYSWVNVMVAAADAKVLTVGIDTLTGTAGDDTFFVPLTGLNPNDRIDDGFASDNDVLQLVLEFEPWGGFFELQWLTFSGIEKIMGTAGNETVEMRANQLAGVKVLDGQGGTDLLIVRGTDIDLSGKQFLNLERIAIYEPGAVIKVDDVATARLVEGYVAQNDTLVIAHGTLSDADRAAIHQKGIETIRTLEDPHPPTTYHPPQVTALGGDRVSLQGSGPVFLDAGRNAVVTSEEGTLGLLGVSLHGSIMGHGEQLGIGVSERVTLSNGMNDRSTVSIDNVVIGTVGLSSSASFSVQFNASATPERVQQLIRALTYTKTDGALEASRVIDIYLSDAGGREIDLTVTVDPSTSTNHPPSIPDLTGSTVDELAANGTVIGRFSATDPDAGDTLHYVLADDAGGRFRLDGDKLVVADGVRLDYEQARSHTVKVRVLDQSDASAERTFTIHVKDVVREAAAGSTRPDVIVGGSGADRLGGGLGHDTLTGGKGNDVFVFDTKPDKATNLDTITDFSVKDDTIQLAKAVFGKAGPKGMLKADAFFIGVKVHDASDRIVYNKKTGALFYDDDGSGKHAAVQIAQLSKNLKMTEKDFIIV